MELFDLPEEHQQNIIGCSINLIEAFSEAFGAEEGIQLWEELSERFGKGVKEAVFMAMLQGRSSGSITIKPLTNPDRINKIELIKTIRTYTGFGLKEAKDVADEVFTGANKHIKVQWQQRKKFIKDLRDIGVDAL